MAGTVFLFSVMDLMALDGKGVLQVGRLYGVPVPTLVMEISSGIPVLRTRDV